jgi:hypothetical protein
MVSWQQVSLVRHTQLACTAAMMGALAGCNSTTPHSGDRALVSVSAVNYGNLTDAEMFERINAPENKAPDTPPVTRPVKPLFYLMLAGEVCPNDVTLDNLYRPLASSLEHRGYYSALAQVKGNRPLKVDYLFRVHYGVRPWETPTVRPDRVTWGNDGLLGKEYKTGLVSDQMFDPRAGLSQQEVFSMGRYVMALRNVKGPTGISSAEANANNAIEAKTFARDLGIGGPPSSMTQAAHDFAFVVVEAFKLADVKRIDRKAPCEWMLFAAVPIDYGQKFSRVLPSMLKASEPYYGATTTGLQVNDVPLGKVEVGQPREVK